ncbi:MAG: L,D-transpeptidase [Parvibaculaceae bacterium]
MRRILLLGAMAVLAAVQASPAALAARSGCTGIFECMNRESRSSAVPRQVVDFPDTRFTPGMVVIVAERHALYYVLPGRKAIRYPIGVGRDGFQWKGFYRIERKAEWPSWVPPAEMIAREAQKGIRLPAYMPGGPNNPLGARALYIGGTLYRIHGTNAPHTIGGNVSSGCIRMLNRDVVDLYERVKVGARVFVYH